MPIRRSLDRYVRCTGRNRASLRKISLPFTAFTLNAVYRENLRATAIYFRVAPRNNVTYKVVFSLSLSLSVSAADLRGSSGLARRRIHYVNSWRRESRAYFIYACVKHASRFGSVESASSAKREEPEEPRQREACDRSGAAEKERGRIKPSEERGI